MLMAAIMAPFFLVLALLLTSEPPYLRAGLGLASISAAVYPVDSAVRKKLLGVELSFHHLFELPFIFLVGIYLGHDVPLVVTVELTVVVILFAVVNNYVFQRLHSLKPGFDGVLPSLGIFLGAMLAGFALGWVALLVR